MKSFFWKTLLCVVPVLVGLAVVGVALRNYIDQTAGYTFKLGVDLVGGTILVYEIDPEKKPSDFQREDLVKLAGKLKQRIDPTDIYNIVIRPVGDARIEVILPTGASGGAATAAREDSAANRKSMSSVEIDRAKELISRAGSLRFVILANPDDDREAFDAARAMYGKGDAGLKETLRVARDAGKPPPGPTPPDRDGFQTPMGRYSYSWVELGPSEREKFNLDNDAATNPARNQFWKQMEEARKKGDLVPAGSLLLYSRDVSPERERKLSERDKGRKYEYFALTRNAGNDPEEIKSKEVTGEYLIRATEGNSDQGGLAVLFGFNAEGGNRFYEMTSRNKKDGGKVRLLGIVLDELLTSSATINEAIRTDGQISGNFTKEEVDRLVTILRSGALPATLKPIPVSESTIGATLGADTIRSGSISVVLAFTAVLIFMLIYYRLSGLIACLALFANLILTVAFMVLVNATFTLPGLAGLVLMLGMAVDANVLIYERLREERERGASLSMAIRNAYDRAFPTIIDTHLSSIFTAIVLYVVGNDQLKGFGISLTLGLLISLFTSLVQTRLMFDFGLSRGLSGLRMMRLFSRPSIDFMGIRYYAFTITLILTILGGALFVYRLNAGGLDIDFTGGTLYSGRLTEKMDLQSLRTLLDDGPRESQLKVADVKEVEGSEGKTFMLTYEGDAAPRRVRLADRTSVEEVRRRAEEMPGFSLEQTYSSSTEFSQGNKSVFFTVRTTEKSSEIVQAALNKLLGDKLRRIQMTAGEIREDKETRRLSVDLTFTEPATDSPDWASEAQVRRTLTDEFDQAGGDLAGQAQLFGLAGDPDSEKGERFSRMTLTMDNRVDQAALKAALARAGGEFGARPQPERLEIFDAQLASDTRDRAFYAILASWGAILLYLWFRFGNWTFGLAAVLCLIHDLFFTLGVIALCHFLHGTFVGNLLGLSDFKINLPTIAALLTLVGYSVNDTIVVFDRIREVRGKNPELTPKTINDSVNQTLSRTILASLTTWLVVLVLYIFGGEGVHLFAFVMVVGVLIGTYSSIYVASPLLLMFGEGRVTSHVRKPESARR